MTAVGIRGLLKRIMRAAARAGRPYSPRRVFVGMTGYNFSERVRKVLAMAREEALRLQHEYVGTEHILLGLLHEGDGVAAAVFQALSIDGRQVADRIEATVKKGRSPHGPIADLPYTSRAKKVLEFAMTEARELRHGYVGTEHLLLGLMREEKGIAAQVLFDAGMTTEDTRTEVLRLLGDDTSSTGPASARRPPVNSAPARDEANAERRPARTLRRKRSLPPADWATDRARGVINRARAAAANRHSRHIEPEHLLIALLQEEGGMASTLLEHLDVDRAALARAAAGAIEETLATDEPFDLDLSWSEPAEAALRHAFHEVRLARDRRVGTDHLLLGLLLEENAPASRLLVEAGLTADAVRTERARIAG